MLKKILLLIIACSVGLNADDYWVYSYGDVTTSKDVFTYLASFREDLDYQDLILLSIMVGATITATLKKFAHLPSFGFYFLGTTATMLLIFSTTTSVNLVNVRFYNSSTLPVGLHYQRVDNTPYIFTVVASTFSNIGYFFTKKIDDEFVAIGGDFADARKENSFLKSGLNGSFSLFTKLNSVELQSMSELGLEFTKVYKDYSKSCLFEVLHTYDPISTTLLFKHSQNLIADIDPTSSAMLQIANIGNFIVNSSNGATTCQALYSNLKTIHDAVQADTGITDFFNNLLKNNVSNPSEMLGGITGMFAGATGNNNALKLKNYVLNTALMKQLAYNFDSYIDETKGGASVSGMVSTFGTELSKGTFVTASLTQGRFAAETLPMLHELIKTFMYVGFPIILIVQIIGGGIKILTNYVLALLWVELWPPSFSILNYFVQKDAAIGATDALIASSGSGVNLPTLLSIANTNMVLETIAISSGIAASTFWLIPMLTGFLIYGGHHSLMGLTSSLMQGGTFGSNLDTLANKQSLQDNLEKAQESGLSKHINAESFAYENTLAKDLSNSSIMQSQIEAFGGLSGLSSISGANASLDAAKTKGTLSTATNEGAYAAGSVAGTKQNANGVTLDTLNSNGGAAAIYNKQASLDTNELIGKTTNMNEKDAINVGERAGLQAQSIQAFNDTVRNNGGSLLEAYGSKENEDALSALSLYRNQQEFNNEELIGAKEAKVQQSVASTNASDAIAEKLGMSRSDYFSMKEEISQAKSTADLQQFQANADKITGKTGIDSVMQFQAMVTGSNQTYTDENGTHTFSVDQNGNYTGQTTSIHTKDGVLVTHHDVNGNEIQSKLDGSHIKTHNIEKHNDKITTSNNINEKNNISQSNNIDQKFTETDYSDTYNDKIKVEKGYEYKNNIIHEQKVEAVFQNYKMVKDSNGEVNIGQTIMNAAPADTANHFFGGLATPVTNLYTSARAQFTESQTLNDGSKRVNFNEDTTEKKEITAKEIASKKEY